MANTLTNLFPTIYRALDVVSREMVGYIPAVSRDVSSERAALGQSILVPITPVVAAADNTPAVTSPDTGDQTIDNVAMTIQKSRHVAIRWNGEQQRGMQTAGTYDDILQQQFEQAFRTLVNEIEADLHAAAYKTASRAYGTAGTAPFGTANDLTDAAEVARILDDNGAPAGDRHLVLGSAAVAKLRGPQSLLLKANENGSDAFRRSGAISEIPIDGFTLHNSAAVKPVVKGTGASYVTDGAVSAGVNDIVLKTGTGTVLAGDIVTFAADANNKYVVNNGVAAPGTITIGEPGLRVNVADANAMTVGGNYTPNVAFHRSAIQLIARAPAAPTFNGRRSDAAIDAMMVTDPVSGLVFEVSVYPQYRQMVFQVAIAWGANAIKSAHTCVLVG